MNHILRVLCFTFLLTTSACGNIAELAEGFLYPVDSANETATPAQPPAGYGQEVLDVAHPNGDLKIHVWYRKSPTATNVPVVIHFHGNGENIGRLANNGFLTRMESLGTHFVVFDYPGYGNSTGRPEQSTLMAAAQATVAWTKKNFPDSPLVFWGWSLGSAVAIQTAGLNNNSVSALIADSAWTTIRELTADKFGSLAGQIPEELYKRNEWNSLSIAPSLRMPLLMRHGAEDKLIGLNFGQRLSEAAKSTVVRFLVSLGRGHGDIFADAPYWTDLKTFVNSAK